MSIKDVITFLNKITGKHEPLDKTPKRFVTSDLHVGHFNVIRFCNRPYSTKEEMDESFVTIWNSRVKPWDIVYVLGDFSMSPVALERIGLRLNGVKHLITGNHDKVFGFKTKKKAAKSLDRYYEVFSSIKNQDVIELKDGRKVLLSHFPYRNEAGGKYDVRYWDQRPVDQGMVLLHGHVHNHYIKMGRMIDVGWDGKLDLWSEDEIIELINDDRDNIPSRITEWYKQQQGEQNEY